MLLALNAFLVDAGIVVNYDGAGMSFPLLAAAYERYGLPRPAPIAVDAFYVALSMWPTARSHGLLELADVLGLDRTCLNRDNAANKAELIASLMMCAATVVAGWSQALVDLAASVCTDSPAWTLMRHMAGSLLGAPPSELMGSVHAHGHADVAALATST